MSEEPHNLTPDEKLEMLLSRRPDGDLDEREARELDERLAADGELRAEAGRYERLTRALQEIAAEDLAGVDYDAQRADILAVLERQALMRGGARRRVALRPVFRITAGLAAAAAVAVFAVSAWWMFRRVDRPVEGAATARVLPANAPPAEQVEVSVVARRLDWREAGLAGAQRQAAARQPNRPPAGTVLVSIGSEDAAPRPAAGAEAMFLEF